MGPEPQMCHFDLKQFLIFFELVNCSSVGFLNREPLNPQPTSYLIFTQRLSTYYLAFGLLWFNLAKST